MKRLHVVKREKQLSIHCKLKSLQIWWRQNELQSYKNKNRIKSFKFESDLEHNCKCCSENAIRENLTGYLHWKKSEVFPFSFIYVWTTFEHQVRDSYELPEVQVISKLRRPKTISAPVGAPTSTYCKRLHLNFSKDNYCGERSRTSKDS